MSIRPTRRKGATMTAASACALLLALPAAAGAATVSLNQADANGDGTFDTATLTYTAAAGEANDLRITQDGQAFTFSDPNATIGTSGTGCTVAGDGRSARCEKAGPPNVGFITVSLLDGDDVATDDTSVAASIDGGAGNDQLTGADVDGVGDSLRGGEGADVLDGRRGDDSLFELGEPLNGTAGGNDTLRGGPGGDSLSSGTGDDVIRGGDGDDVVIPGAGADQVDGEGGIDEVSYSDRSEPVRVDLTAGGGQGQAGENDTIAGVEDVAGGTGADTIVGDGASNRLSGGTGADAVTGGGGADLLYGEDGDDTLDAKDGGGDRVLCGNGTDTATADDVDALSGCEQANVTPAVPGSPGPGGGAAADVTAPVLAARRPARTWRRRSLTRGLAVRVASNEPARLTAQIVGRLGKRGRISRAGDVTLAETRASLAAGAARTIRLKPTRSARRALPRRGRVKLAVVLTAVDAGGNVTTRRFTVTLR